MMMMITIMMMIIFCQSFFISGFDGQSLNLQLLTFNFFLKFRSIKVQLFRGYDFKVQLFHTCTVLKNMES